MMMMTINDAATFQSHIKHDRQFSVRSLELAVWIVNIMMSI